MGYRHIPRRKPGDDEILYDREIDVGTVMKKPNRQIKVYYKDGKRRAIFVAALLPETIMNIIEKKENYNEELPKGTNYTAIEVFNKWHVGNKLKHWVFNNKLVEISNIELLFK
jgi:hypothetical protein